MTGINVVIAIVVFIIGSMIGSFLNVCIYRIPRKESIIFPSSHCPNCQKQIEYRDNIPILSYLLLKGRCRFCGVRISPQYPIIELSTALLLLTLFLKYGLTLNLLASSFFVCILIVISGIDFEHLLIPNKIVVPSMVVGFLLVLISGYQEPQESLIGFLIGGGFLMILALVAGYVFKQESLGGGDIKLAAFVGLFLGRFVLMALFWGFFLGGLIGLVLVIFKRKTAKDRITFGPFISTGALIALLFGDFLWAFYLSLI